MTKPAHVESYYAATVDDLPDFPALEGSVDVDVCIVGAGFTGLSAALHLVERGYRVAVLEAARVGWGASGRNGGQIVTGFAAGLDKVIAKAGDADARRLWAMSEEAKRLIEDRVARHGIACDLKWGYLHAAVKARQVRELADELALWENYGYGQGRMVGRDEVRALVASDAYVGGLYDGDSGHLNPLAYALGLARAADGAGAMLFEDSRVTAIEGMDARAGGRVTVRTAKGAVTADHLLLAGNAYLGGLAPALRRKVMPVGTYIIATEALGEDRAHALIPGDVAVADCNFVLNYFRLSADHRMLFGGRVSYSTIEPPNLAATMRRSMLKVFPQLADAAVDYCWGGYVGITVDRTPHLGRLAPNVYFAQGFSGHGVALTGLAGKLFAEAVAGTAERFDVFAKLRHMDFPGGALRTPALVLAMLYYRMRDLL